MDNYTFNDFDIQLQVLAFMRQNGIIPFNPDLPIIADGRIRRFRTQDDDTGETSGAYCIFSDSWPAGWVEDWRSNNGAITWSFSRDALNDEAKSFFNDENYYQALKKSKERQQKLLEEYRIKQTEASEFARTQFEQSAPAPQDHQYL